MEVTWTKGIDMPDALEGFSAVSVKDFGIYIFGGVDANGIEQNILYHYSPTNQCWRKVRKNIRIRKTF